MEVVMGYQKLHKHSVFTSNTYMQAGQKTALFLSTIQEGFMTSAEDVTVLLNCPAGLLISTLMFT